LIAVPDGAAAEMPWIIRCASRLVDFERDLPYDEAVKIARAMKAFERTGAMEPDAAVEFVAHEMHKSGSPRFERRAAQR
jgi:hypothetical protein